VERSVRANGRLECDTAEEETCSEARSEPLRLAADPELPPPDVTYRDEMGEAIADGLSADEAAEEVRLDAYAGWGQYEEWFPMNVRGMYRLLTER
jgi:hypothetical protein